MSQLRSQPVVAVTAQLYSPSNIAPDDSSTAQNGPNRPNFSNLNSRPQSLDEKQRAAIELLALGKSFSHAAKLLEVGRRTLFTWRQDAFFRSELARRHGEIWGDTAERIRMLADPCIEALVEQLNDNPRARFRAATALLRLAKLSKQS